MKMYKGFDENLKCRDFQYKVGQEYIHEGDVSACESGFHACKNPFDVFSFYPPNKSRYCEVDGDGRKDTREDKTSFEKIKIVMELGLGGLIHAGINFCFEKVRWSKQNSATGYKSGASATGNYSGASATGYKSGASAGKGSVALSVGMQSRAKGTAGAFIVLTECHKDESNGQFYIDCVKCAKVDGDKIKPDVWYTLQNGEFVEANI